MFSTDEPMLANHFTMASIDIPSDVEVVVRILAENGARYRFDASSLEAVTPSAEHPYGDPNLGPVAARGAFVDGVVREDVPGRWRRVAE